MNVMYRIKQASELSGVSVRTLHYYDEIGLLSPHKSENGYRYYSEEDMGFLQTILFYKYLGFPLRQIKQFLKKENLDLIFHLKKQLSLMQKEKEQIVVLIETLQKTIDSEERKIIMLTKEKFKGFTCQDSQKYKQKAIEKYGKEAIETSVKKQKGREQEVTDAFNEIFFSFSENMMRGVENISLENIHLSKNLHEYLCKYCFDCSIDVFSSIGYGYVKNPEFKMNLDKFGEGTAQYICNSIQNYVDTVKNKNEI